MKTTSSLYLACSVISFSIAVMIFLTSPLKYSLVVGLSNVGLGINFFTRYRKKRTEEKNEERKKEMAQE